MARDRFHGVSELGRAGKHRHDDARALFSSGRWRCAMYIAGYSVECLLKTKLMRMFNSRNLRELEASLQQRGSLGKETTLFTHQLEVLLRLTQSFDRLRRRPATWRQFNIVNRWVPAWRYSADQSNSSDAEDFLEAVDGLSHWIDHNV
jgi:HEPN domain-containing protein